VTVGGSRRARLLWVVLALPMLGGCWWHGYRGEGRYERRDDRRDERRQERREEHEERERHGERDDRR
jgi:hypothetical protein